MLNDEMMRSPFEGIRSMETLSDFEHSSFFRHSSLGFRHFGAEDTPKPDDSDSSLEINTSRKVIEMFHPMRVIRFGSLLAAVLMIGCSQNNQPENSSQKEPQKQAPKETLSWSGWEKELTLDVATWEGIQERIAAHKGQVVVLDIWATH